jgi:Spore Coat Protein U domain
MKLHRIALACFALYAMPAMAAITCGVVVTPISTVYSPTITPENISTGSYTVTCTRTAGDPTTLNYDLAAGNGLQPSGVINRVQLGATTNRYNYELYRLAPYINTNRWQLTNLLRFAGSLNFGSGFVATSGEQPFVLRIPPMQTVRPAGIYTDMVAATLRQDMSATVLATTNFDVTVITDNTCEISTPPGAINFSYTSFQTTAATASTTFYTRCTTGLPYSVAVDTLPASPASLDLVYSLGLTPVTSPTSPATGSGLPQLFTITGTMPANQSGTCAAATCTATEPRTITITY